MADDEDSKSFAGNCVRVRVPPPALYVAPGNGLSKRFHGAFFMSEIKETSKKLAKSENFSLIDLMPVVLLHKFIFLRQEKS